MSEQAHGTLLGRRPSLFSHGRYFYNELVGFGAILVNRLAAENYKMVLEVSFDDEDLKTQTYEPAPDALMLPYAGIIAESDKLSIDFIGHAIEHVTGERHA